MPYLTDEEYKALYSEDEVKELIKLALNESNSFIEFYEEDAAFRSFNNKEFDNWFEANRKPTNDREPDEKTGE